MDEKKQSENLGMIPTTWNSLKVESVKKTGAFQGWEEIEWVDREEFSGNETILCDTIMVDICLYTFDQTHRMHIKSEPHS